MINGSEQRTAHREQRTAVICSLLALLCSLPLHAASLSEQAQAAWSSRDKPGQTEKAIQLWSEAVREEPRHAELWIDLAKAYGRGVRHAAKSKERKTMADHARSAAERAVYLAPQSAEAYTVYGEALGQWTDNHRGIHSLSMVKQAVEALNKAIAIDPKHAPAHMLLAEFYRQSPAVVSIGDKQKALEQARLAVLFGPAYAINHLALAQACLDLGKKEEGIAELKIIQTLPPPADAIPETRADQETARNILQSLGITTTQTSSSCGETGNACVDHP